MKKLFLILFSFVSISIFGQIGMEIKYLKRNGIKFENLESNYVGTRVNNPDSTKSIFCGRINEFGNAWKKMLQSLQDTLSHSNFIWEKPTNISFKILFNKNGSIDYFLYRYRTRVRKAKKREFNRILNEFIKVYKFPFTNDVAYSQCGGVNFEIK